MTLPSLPCYLKQIYRRSPHEVPLPPVRLAIVGVHVHQELPRLLPEQQSHREGHSGNTHHEEGQLPATEDTVHSRSVQQEDEDAGLQGNTAEHVLVEA